MIRVFSLIVAVVFCVQIAWAFPESPQRAASARMGGEGTVRPIPGMAIVKIRQGLAFRAGSASLGIAALDARFATLQVRSLSPLKSASPLRKVSAEEEALTRIFILRYDANEDPALAARALAADPSVEYAEPYYEYPFTHTPNDPRVSQQWAIGVMKLAEAWDVTKGDSTLLIGDVDSGVDWTHEDLQPSIFVNKREWGTAGELANNGVDDDGNGKTDDWHGWDFIGSGTTADRSPDNDPMDNPVGHGTNTSGCAAALANNGLGVAGTSYRSKVLAVKAASDDATLGIGAGYEGIIYAADRGCRVINCSWGGMGTPSQAMQDVITYARNKGALVIGSSGNDPYDNDYVPHWPSSFLHVLNVGSVESTGAVSQWCTYGASVGVFAPGTQIYTTKRGGGYTNPTGTSFSTPLTAGVAALVFSVHPDWTPDQVMAQIRVTSDAFSTPRNPKYYGRVNAYRAVTVNQNLTDLPGLILKSFSLSGGSGGSFTKPGQTVRVRMEIQNVLAPTSAQAVAVADLDHQNLALGSTSFALGAMPTMDSRTLEFDAQLSASPTISEGWLPVRLKITDGAYTDYVLVRIPILLDIGWKTAVNTDLTAYSSIDVVNETTVWATVTMTNNQAICLLTRNGQTWQSAYGTGFPTTGKGVYCVAGVSGTLGLVGTGPSNGAAEIFRTTNSGQVWRGVSVSSITPFVNWIHMFDANTGVFQGDPISGTWGLAKTSDGGVTWTPLATPVPAGASEAGWNNSYDFVGQTGWFGTNSGKIYKTTDGGDTWRSIATPSVHSVGLSFRDALVGVARFNVQNNTGVNMLAITRDGGETWTPITTITVTDQEDVVMEKSGSRLWVLRNGSVLVSRDLGATWTAEPIPPTMSAITCTSTWSSAISSFVYAAGIDVFKFVSPLEKPVSTDRPSPLATECRIRSIHPNPARDQVQIAFTLPATQTATLALHDNSGRLLRTLVQAQLTAGEHGVVLPLHGLPAGAYHLVLETPSARVVESVIVR